MNKESKPFKFQYVKEIQPLRINIEEKTIYANSKVLLNAIRSLVNSGLDWKEIMRYNLLHEKAHEKFYKWNRKWKASAADYGWLPSFIIDVVIDRIHLRDNNNYQKWILLDYKQAFKNIRTRLWKGFPIIAMRPMSLYNQAAYWVALEVISLDEATDLYPEMADYITELSQLFRRIESEEDLEWAYPAARRLFLERASGRV